ncbi:hypothetical protein C0J52_03672, partial [Blattella germanica]
QHIGGKVIPQVKHCKYLGVYLSESLGWDTRANSGIWSLMLGSLQNKPNRFSQKSSEAGSKILEGR